MSTIETITISKFKATCLELLRKVKQTGQSIIVTRNGEQIAMIVAPPPPKKTTSWLGSFSDSGSITGDIMEPVLSEEQWNVLK